jgi:hypothetical protein
MPIFGVGSKAPSDFFACMQSGKKYLLLSFLTFYINTIFSKMPNQN